MSDASGLTDIVDDASHHSADAILCIFYDARCSHESPQRLVSLSTRVHEQSGEWSNIAAVMS